MNKTYKVNYYKGITQVTEFFDTPEQVTEFVKQFENENDYTVYKFDDLLEYYRLTSEFWKK